MKITDKNNREILKSNKVIFAKGDNLYEGTVVSLEESFTLSAVLEVEYFEDYLDASIPTKKIAKFKLEKTVPLSKMGELNSLQTSRLCQIPERQDDSVAKKNSLQAETYKENLPLFCLACAGSGGGPTNKSKCIFCNGDGLYTPPLECSPRHASLDEALSCQTCQNVMMAITNYKAAIRQRYGRGSPESPCEYCKATRGHYLKDACQRCIACGHARKVNITLE